MNTLPSTSSIRAPEALRMKSGDASTALNARTGLSTPPGRTRWARVKRRDERLEHGAALVDPAVLGRGLQHRVLAADVVRRGRVVERVLHARDDVEIGDRRLHH